MATSLGDAFTVASSFCFAASNILVAQGNRDSREDNGAFVSLLITAGIAAVLWAGLGALRGFEPVTWRAIAWFSGAGVFTAFVGRVFFYAAIEKLGAMRSSTMKRLIPFFAVMLGVGVLGERFTTGMLAGMTLILLSFVMLVGGARGTKAQADRKGGGMNAGYIYGPVSALGYATGYLLRKMGLAEAHDALLGAAVGCVAGAALFVVTAAFSASYAKAVRATFKRPSPWLLAGGTAATFGQVFYFAALNENAMARVALVSSSEVFITLLLGWIFLRRRETMTLSLVLAAVLGFLGAALVIEL
jgi:drug/metabolite transporter (DMT)-like permease